MLRRYARLPSDSDWSARPRGRGGGRACYGAQAQGRTVPGADARASALVVVAAEVGGRWSDECQQFLRTLLRLRFQRAPPPLRASATQGWVRRWWSVLSVALQRAVASSALGVWTMPPLPGASDTL